MVRLYPKPPSQPLLVPDMARFKPTLARLVEFDKAAKTFKVNGQDFPYYITEEGPILNKLSDHDIQTVTVTIIVDGEVSTGGAIYSEGGAFIVGDLLTTDELRDKLAGS